MGMKKERRKTHNALIEYARRAPKKLELVPVNFSHPDFNRRLWNHTKSADSKH